MQKLESSTREDARKCEAPDQKVDVQGIQWEANGLGKREEFAARFNTRLYRYMCVLSEFQVPKYAQTSENMAGRYMRAKEYLKVPELKNYHMQLHDNFRAAGPFDFIYPSSNNFLLKLNTQTMQTHRLMAAQSVTSLDTHKNLLLVGYEGSNISLLDLESSSLIWTVKFNLQQEHQLINCIKFLDDRAGGIKTVVAGNKHTVDLFDLEKSTTALSQIPVDYFVNRVALSPDNSLIALAYDHTDVEVFDVRSCEKVQTLKGHKDYSFAVDFHSTGHSLASGNQDLTTRVWDLRVGKEHTVLPTRYFASGYLRYIQNSRYLVMGENYNSISIYVTESMYHLRSDLSYFGELVGIDFSKDERELFAGIGRKVEGIDSGILKAEIGPKSIQF